MDNTFARDNSTNTNDIIGLDEDVNNLASTDNSNININNSIVNDFASGLSSLYDRVDQSVVQITQSFTIPENSRLGSGFVYDREGHIITNYHVVAGEDIDEEFDITFTDGSTYKATVIGEDPFAEIAVLKITSNNDTMIKIKEKLVPLPIGNFSEVDVGQRVAAVGNLFGLSA